MHSILDCRAQSHQLPVDTFERTQPDRHMPVPERTYPLAILESPLGTLGALAHDAMASGAAHGRAETGTAEVKELQQEVEGGRNHDRYDDLCEVPICNQRLWGAGCRNCQV